MSLFGDLVGQQGQVRAIITSLSFESIGVELTAFAAGAPASTAWSTANKAIFIPFMLQRSATIVKLFHSNGSTASGNIDMGIYNEGGTRQVSIGSTAQSGTSANQVFDITDTTLVPGRYYLAVALDNATGTSLAVSGAALSPRQSQMFGIMEQTSAFALPATATFAPVSANVVVPVAGLSLRTVVA